MNLKIEAQVLRAALEVSLAKRGTIAVLEHALLSVGSDGRLSVTTSNLAQELTFYVDAQATAQAPLAVRADLLKAALYALDGEVALSLTDGRMVLKQGRRQFKIPTLPGAEFPRLDVGASTPLGVDPRALAVALARVSYCASKKDIRYYLNGVQLRPGYVAAADGYRMAIDPLTCAGLPPAGVLIPIDSVKLVCETLRVADSVALEGKGRAYLTVHGAGQMLHTKLMDASCPDLEKVAADVDRAPVIARIAVPALVSALARVRHFCQREAASGTTGFYQTRLAVEDGTVAVSSAHDAGTVDPVPAESTARVDSVVVETPLLADLLSHAQDAAICEWRHIDHLQVQRFTFDQRADRHYTMPWRE